MTGSQFLPNTSSMDNIANIENRLELILGTRLLRIWFWFNGFKIFEYKMYHVCYHFSMDPKTRYALVFQNLCLVLLHLFWAGPIFLCQILSQFHFVLNLFCQTKCLMSIDSWYVVHTSDGNRTVPSREVPGRSRDGTGQDLETLKVPWSCGPGTKEV